MRRIINSTYMTLDGVVQEPQEWTFGYRDDGAATFAHDQLFSCDAILMGRHTYEIFAGYWPSANDDDGSAERMNALPKYVVSDSLTGPAWNNTSVVRRAEFAARMRELKQQPGQDIVQYGYGPVTAELLREGLLDELRIWLHPILVGGHRPDRLLAALGADARLRLRDHQVYDSGMVILAYRPEPDN